MITEWSKRWADGRVEYVTPEPAEIEFSEPTFSVSIRKLEREIMSSPQQLAGLRLPAAEDIPWDYRAIDVKAHRDADEREYLYIIYGTSLDTYDDVPALPYSLYFAKWDVASGSFVTFNVLVSDSAGLAHERRACINVYDDHKVWVTYMSNNLTQIISKTSTDGGVTWANKKIIHTSNSSFVFQEEGALSNRKLVGKQWVTKSYVTTETVKRAYGGKMLRSQKTGQSAEFTVNGTEVYLYTYATKAQGHVGVFKCWIDGKFQGSFDMRKNGGYRTEVKLNKKTMSNGSHRVKLQHVSGRYFFIDAVKTYKPSPYSYNLCDAIIRANTGSTNGVYGQEAMVLVTYQDTAKKKKREALIVDNSGTGIFWGTSYQNTHWFNDWDKKYGAAGRQGYFHEGFRGLWILFQTEENGNQVLQHWLWKGKASENAAYSKDTWAKKHSRQPTKNQFIRFTAGSANKGGFVLTLLSSRGTANRDEGQVAAAYASFSQDLEFSGIDFELPDRSVSPFCAFNWTPDHEGNVVGLLCTDDNGVPTVYSVRLEATTAEISNIKEYVSELSIDHSFHNEPSAMRFTIVNQDNVFSTRSEASLFYGLLPSNYFDKALREVSVLAKFDQGPYAYEVQVFHGILGEVVEDYVYGNMSLSLSAFDFGKWLQNFHAPYYLLYANPPLDWAENAQDYPVYIEGGTIKNLPLRTKRVEYENTADKKKEITVGWDFDNSCGEENFEVNVAEGFVHQTSSGFVMSPMVGNGEHNCNAEFMINSTSTGTVEFGFQIASWTQTSGNVKGTLGAGSVVVCDLDNKKVRLYMKDKDADIKLVGEKDFTFIEGRTYRIFTWAEQVYVKVWICDKYDPLTQVEMNGRHVWNEKRWGTKCPERVYIGSSSTEIELGWDNIYMSSRTKTSRDFKTDKEVGLDIVAKAFQGILPLREKSSYNGDYFVGIIMHPAMSAYEAMNQLAFQNNSSWYFDYDGALVWNKRHIDMPVATLTDNQITSLSLSFNPLEFKNWVEVAGGENLKVWTGFSDFQSVIRDGMRYTMVEEDEIRSSEHAAKLALNEFYSYAENMENVSLELSKPFVFIQPRDVVRIDSDSVGAISTKHGYSSLYYVNSVAMTIDSKGLKMTMTLSSRPKAMIEAQGRIYSEGGIPG